MVISRIWFLNTFQLLYVKCNLRCIFRVNDQGNRMKFYASIYTSALAEEDFEGKNLKEKVESIEVLEVNCILFIRSNEKTVMQLCIWWLNWNRLKKYCIKLYNGNVKWQEMWFLTLKCILIIWQWFSLWWYFWHGTEIFLHCTSYIKSVFSWHPCLTEVGGVPYAWDQFQLPIWAWLQKSPYDASLLKISWWFSQKGCCIM